MFRYPLDRRVLGRNAYANLYQFQAQLQFLERLQRVRAAPERLGTVWCETRYKASLTLSVHAATACSKTVHVARRRQQ